MPLRIAILRRSNFSAPIPLGTPGDITFFFSCPGLLITTFLPCPALYKHYNHTFFKCPALFYHLDFFSDPGAARGGWGQKNLTGA